MVDMVQDVIKVDLAPARYLTHEAMIEVPNEKLLMVLCCDYFFANYQPPYPRSELLELFDLKMPAKLAMFYWQEYRAGREWLGTRQALASYLTLRRRPRHCSALKV